jgi:hypothetical protein
VLCALLAAGPAASAPVATVAARDLRAGQRAEVRTVFSGDSVETFEAEIVGVLRGGRAQGDLILARATTPRVVASGVAQGMSGSPVYVDGRLAGALSSGWAFTREPLFGVTPIGEMLDVLDQPAGSPSGPSAGPSGVEAGDLGAPLRYGVWRWSGDEDEPESAADLGIGPPLAAPAVAAGPGRLPLPLAAGGLHPEAREALGPAFAALGFSLVPGGAVGGEPAGAAARRAIGGSPVAAAAPPLAPGAAVAVDLLRGDLQLSAIGTLTWTDGERVLLFGHPFFQAGHVNLPLSTAEIVTVVASQQTSFKLGASGREIGAVTQDRRAAVAGRLGAAPRLLPVSLAIAGAGPRPQRFRFESIEDRQLLPLLAGAATLNGLLESGGAGALQTLRWRMTLHRAGAPPLTLEDVAAGDAPAPALIAGIQSPLAFLASNPFERLRLDSLALEVRVEPGRDQWQLRSARVLDPAVRPGGRAHVRCELERWRGERTVRTIEIAVPREAPDGRYVLFVGGASEITRYEAGRLPGRFRPVSLDDAWERFGALRRGDALYAALYAQAPEVTREGRDYPELPLSALPLLAGGQVAGDVARRGQLATLDDVRVPLGGAVHGELLLAVQVAADAP